MKNALAPHGGTATDDLISEKEVLRRRPVLSKSRLVSARKGGLIRWTKGKRGSAWYRLSDVDAFIKTHMEYQCRNLESILSLNLGDNGSQETTLTSQCSTVSGLSPELAEQVAQALAQQI